MTLAAVCVYCAWFAQGTGASGLTPRITGFKAKPSILASAGGEVSFSAKLPGIATCTISVTPSYGGLPSPFACGEGVKWRYVVVPPNTTASTVSYQYTVTARYTDGTILVSLPTTVMIASAPAATYVALGDSYAAGTGNKGNVDRTGKHSAVANGCERSTAAFPVSVGKWLPKQASLPTMSLRFLACDGATTEDIWNSGAHTWHGLKERKGLEWQQLQDTADLLKARVVTVMTGGDDLNFADILKTCTGSSVSNVGCDGSSSDQWVANLEPNILTLEPILKATYEEIEAAAPNAALYVVGYPDLFPGNASLVHQEVCAAQTAIPAYGVQYLIERQGTLTAAVESAAEEAHAHFVNPNYTGQYGFWGHDVCAASKWFNNAPGLVLGDVPYHPNKSGQKALAEDVKAAVMADSSRTPPTGMVASITAATVHTCATDEDGAAWCWGQNGAGQLGNGTTTDSLTAVAVDGMTSAMRVAAGAYDTCALLSGGTVECWGENWSGQLGTGNETPSTVPRPVGGLTKATSIAAGIAHTCAVLTTGTVKCWGSDSSGELGAEHVPTRLGFPESDVPIEVTGISTAVSISSASADTCAVLSGGTIDCWGENANGQLGDGTTATRFTPVQVTGITNAVAVSAGDSHTCALLADGTVRCWGSNQGGQLGDGTTTASSTPVTVQGLSGAAGIAAGHAHTCALIDDGSIRCWGLAGNGQLGNGMSGSGAQSTVPVVVSGITDARAIAAGQYHSCAVLRTGNVKCWGANYAGQLGDSTSTQRLVPVSVLGLP